MHEREKIYNTASEEELVAFAKSGDSVAANELVLRLYTLVYFTSEKYTGLGIERADLIQEGMIGVLGAMRTFHPESGTKFKTYAARCVDHHFYSLARKVYRKKHIPRDKIVSISHYISNEAQNPEQLVIEKERQEEITAALKAKLSNFEFEILYKYLSGYSAAEIAELLGIDVKQVSNALYRIRQKFHFILK
ncbi:MAG: sigma-70 family RNA polymerase sigma factor [Clostridia bacterium]|nr:sigma-70 family RNA polymerase sigma factor [Clostridia bacterium]